MKCPTCGNKMLELITSVVCEVCEAAQLTQKDKFKPDVPFNLTRDDGIPVILALKPKYIPFTWKEYYIVDADVWFAKDKRTSYIQHAKNVLQKAGHVWSTYNFAYVWEPYVIVPGATEERWLAKDWAGVFYAVP